MPPHLRRSVDARAARFIDGDDFSNSFIFDFGRDAVRPRDRLALLRDLVSGRSVIDFGCADHLPQIVAKVAAGNWAHGVIRESAKECWGFDIDSDGIAAVNAQLGFAGSSVFDVMSDPVPDHVRNRQWDFLILGEVLEHIPNPAVFLERLREAFPNIGAMILTVPNALRAQNLVNSIRHREQINSDHRFWFTPYTLAKILHDGGWRLEAWQFCESFPTGRYRWLRNLVLTRWPEFSAGLIGVASPLT